MLTKKQITCFDPCDVELDDLVLFVIQLKQVKDAYTHNFLSCPIPEWLEPKWREVEAELGTRLRAERERHLRNLKARRETLLPREEKRTQVEQEIALLEKELGS